MNVRSFVKQDLDGPSEVAPQPVGLDPPAARPARRGYAPRVDERLRQLEREARGGDPAAQARLQAERARLVAGASDRLRVAALLDDVVAREVLGAETPAAVPLRVDALLEALALERTSGRDALARAALAAAVAARGMGSAPDSLKSAIEAGAMGPDGAWIPASTLVGAPPAPLDPRVVAALGAARAWLDLPEQPLRAVLHAAFDALGALSAATDPWAVHHAAQEAAGDPTPDGGTPVDWDAAYLAAYTSAAIVRAVHRAVRCVVWHADGASRTALAGYAREALVDAAEAVGTDAVLAAVRGELLAWSRGEAAPAGPAPEPTE